MIITFYSKDFFLKCFFILSYNNQICGFVEDFNKINMSLRIIFMGTPDFAVPTLDALVQNGYNIVGVITATDKLGGRGGKKVLQSAIKRYALEKELNILQPKNLKNPDFVENLRALKADLQVVVAFRMLPEVVWNMPPKGTINLHGSLLPKYRGAAPIHWAVINGETETGVTSFFLQHAIDTGDILQKATLPIGEDDTTGDVHDKMMHLAAEVVLESVHLIETGNYELEPQDDSQVSKAPKIFRETCNINFDQPTSKVHNFIRGLSPFPAAWTKLDDLEFKIFRSEKEIIEHDESVGTINTDHKSYLKFATQDGYIHAVEVKMAGKRKMGIKDFLNGYKLK